MKSTGISDDARESGHIVEQRQVENKLPPTAQNLPRTEIHSLKKKKAILVLETECGGKYQLSTSQDPESPQGQTLDMFMRSFLIGFTGVERLRLDEVDAIPWAVVLDQMTRIKMSTSIHLCFLPVDAM